MILLKFIAYQNLLNKHIIKQNISLKLLLELFFRVLQDGLSTLSPFFDLLLHLSMSPFIFSSFLLDNIVSLFVLLQSVLYFLHQVIIYLVFVGFQMHLFSELFIVYRISVIVEMNFVLTIKMTFIFYLFQLSF